MKNSLDHLYKNGDYSNALKTLRHLEQSLVETRENAQRLALQLAERNPQIAIDSVSAALEIIDGQAPTHKSMDILRTEYSSSVRKAKIIELAIVEHRANMKTLRISLSVEACAKLRREHVDAVRSIASSLKSLDAAFEVEADIRSFVEMAGYRSMFTSLNLLELGRLMQPDSPMLRHYREASNYVSDYDDDVSGKLDKPTAVRLLIDVPGFGASGDIVSMEGRLARHHARIGRVEETNEKPQRAAKPQSRLNETVLE